MVTWVTTMTTIHSMLRLPIIIDDHLTISGCLWFMWNLIIELCWLLIIRMNPRRRLSWGRRQLSGVGTMYARPHFDILRSSTRWLRSLYSCCPGLIKNFVCYIFSESPIDRKTSGNHGSLACFLGNITHNPCMLAGLTYSLLWILESHHIHGYTLHIRHV